MLIEAPTPAAEVPETAVIEAEASRADPSAPPPPARWGMSALGLWQWPIVVALAVGLSLLLTGLKVTSASFLGPMLAGLAMAFAGTDLKVSRKVTVASQAVIGCMLALAVNASILTFVGHHWAAILAVILATGAAAALVAFGLVRFTTLSPETAAWGSMPGAANIMVMLAADSGGDPRLVAFMQYVRVIVVLSTASAVASLLIGTGVHPPAGGPVAKIAAPVDYGLLATLPTLAMAIVGLTLGRVLKIPAGPLLITALIGAVARVYGLFPVVLPPWIFTLAKGAVGVYVGLQFDRKVMGQALRNLPAMVLGMMAIIVLCAGAGVILSLMLGVDFMTGYLATSPGAIDSIAILALGGQADMSIVMAIQTLRFFGVIVMAPYLVKLIMMFMPKPAIPEPSSA
jgi:membrane AbrB-like protein